MRLLVSVIFLNLVYYDIIIFCLKFQFLFSFPTNEEFYSRQKKICPMPSKINAISSLRIS